MSRSPGGAPCASGALLPLVAILLPPAAFRVPGGSTASLERPATQQGWFICYYTGAGPYIRKAPATRYFALWGRW